MKSERPAAWAAARIEARLVSGAEGDKPYVIFWAIVPGKRTGDWGTRAMRERREGVDKVEMFWEEIQRPFVGFVVLVSGW